MTAPLRVIDTGLLPPRQNIAITAALAELHVAGEIPDTLRVQRFERSVLVGRSQDVEAAVRLDRCRADGVAVARRITGGGAIYMEPGVLSWAMIGERRRFGRDFDGAAAAICAAVAEALTRLGIPARVAPPNAITVDDYKIGGASGCFDGATLVHEGTVLVDFSLDRMVAALRLPDTAPRVRSLKALGHSASLAGLRREIGLSTSKYFDFSMASSELSTREQVLADALFASEIGTDAFVFGERAQPAQSAADRVPA